MDGDVEDLEYKFVLVIFKDDIEDDVFLLGDFVIVDGDG